MSNLIKHTSITSLQLVDEINIFRKEEGNRSEIRHADLLKVIRDEFEEEIGMGKISHTPYIHPQNGQTYEMYELTKTQATQVLVRESKFVRKAVVAKLEKQEELLQATPVLPSSKELALMVIRAEEEKERLEAEKKQLEAENAKLAPKAEWVDKVLKSDKTYTATNIAKSLGMRSGQVLNDKLCEMKIQYKQDDQYLLFANYSTQGYTANRTHQRFDGRGVSHTHTYTVWTERGRAFLHFLFNEQLSYGKPAKAKMLAASPQAQQLFLSQ